MAQGGTNLAKESGGNLATIVTSLGILDDFDESDRCKVNLIVGQAGISAGAGAVGATTPRVTLASDDPAVAHLATIAGSVSGGMVNTELPAAAALADNTANPTAPAVGAFSLIWDGSTWDRAPGNSTDGILVNLGANNDVTIGAALPAGGNTIGDVTISGEALVSLQLLDDCVFTDDTPFTPASSKVFAIGCIFDDVASDTVNEGDIGAPRMSSRREQYIQVRDAAGNERGQNVNASGEALVAASQSGTWNVGTVTTVTTVSTVTTVTSITNTVNTKEVKAATLGYANVVGVASATTLRASNANRLGLTIYNDSTAILYVKLGTGVTTSSFSVKLHPDDYYEVPFGYTGDVEGIWASATGSARVSELTA